MSMFVCYSWPAMGIHGDKSQQERDWVLNGMPEIFSKCFLFFFSRLLRQCLTKVSFHRVQIRQGPHPHRHWRGLPRSRSVWLWLNPLVVFLNIFTFLKKVVLAFFNFYAFSEFFSPKGAVFVAGPRHDKSQASRGKEDILEMKLPHWLPPSGPREVKALCASNPQVKRQCG